MNPPKESGSKNKNLDEIFKKLESSNEGLSTSTAKLRLEKFGPNAIEEKRTSNILKFLGYFWGPIPWMIEIAAILSLIVQHYPDFIFITILLLFNALVAFIQEFQAGNAIESLKKKLAITTRVLRDGKWQEINAQEIVPGDIIRIRLGDIAPADAILIEGEYLSVDQSALTGESLPVSKKMGDSIYSGSIIQKGEMVALVTATGKDSYMGKTIELVASAKVTSHFQKAVLQIGDFLIYLSLGLVFVLFVVQLSRGDSFFELVKFALILTVASIPVALPAILSVTMAVGALSLSKMKAIVTRLQSIEEMAGVDTLLCDKTGTLTQNQLTIGEPILFGKASKDDIIHIAALASRAEDMDIIDLTILEAAKKLPPKEGLTQKSFTPFDPTSKRTQAVIQALELPPLAHLGSLGPSEPSYLLNSGKALAALDSQENPSPFQERVLQRQFEVTKGAPQVILSLCHVEQQVAKQFHDFIESFAKKGYRTLGVAQKEVGKNWEFLGLIPLYDPPRVDSKETIKQAKEHGIHVKMLTGDNLAIAKEIATQLTIGQNIVNANVEISKDTPASNLADKVEKADGFAEVFPETKYLAVKALQSKWHIVGMTGDGVNDAPALKQADLGIAVSKATDAARSAASLVLTAPGLSVIIKAVEEARRIFERMNSYAIYRITETIRIMIFIVLAILIYNFYPITALMIILLALLNDIPIMTIAYDHTYLSKEPVKWDMRRVIFTAFVLGLIGVVETFLLMTIAMLWLKLPLEELRSMIFLKLSVAGHLTLFIARAKHAFFLKPFPSPLLLIAILSTQAVAALIVGFGIFVTALPWIYVGFVWAYCLVWMFIEDIAKLLLYRHFELSQPYHQKFIRSIKETFSPLFYRNNHPNKSK